MTQLENTLQLIKKLYGYELSNKQVKPSYVSFDVTNSNETNELTIREAGKSVWSTEQQRWTFELNDYGLAEIVVTNSKGQLVTKRLKLRNR